MFPVCRSKVCADVVTTPYTTENLPLLANVPTPINAVPTTFTASKTASAAIVFTGYVVLVTGTSSPTLTVTLTYSNTAVPSVVVLSQIPVMASLATGVHVPISISLDVTLPCGVYVANVTLATSANTVVDVEGSLNVSLTFV